jgi:pimeloyl-ACP methyl ester carboxylesterase
MLAKCGHAPHRDQPDATESAMVAFVDAVVRNESRST